MIDSTAPENTPKQRINILSIDGGGIRGVIPTTFLEAIEQQLGRPTNEIFHTIGGTSTGGLTSVMLSVPKTAHGASKQRSIMRASKVTNFYKEQGRLIFPSSVLNLRRSILWFVVFGMMACCLGTCLLLRTVPEPAFEKMKTTNILLRFFTESSKFTMFMWTVIILACMAIYYLLNLVDMVRLLSIVLKPIQDLTYAITDITADKLNYLLPIMLAANITVVYLLQKALSPTISIFIAEQSGLTSVTQASWLYTLFYVQLCGAFFFFSCIVRYLVWPKFSPETVRAGVFAAVQ